MRASASLLERHRQEATCELPAALSASWSASDSPPVPADEKFVDTIKGLFPATHAVSSCKLGSGTALESIKPLKVGVVLSGGQAPGGHNVVAGIYDAVKRTGHGSALYGFLDGPHGIFTGNVTHIDDAMMDCYRNTGGFDMIGSGRHKIETPEQFEASASICSQLDLDGLVVIGGDDSNTNAALLAEYFAAQKLKTKVVGCPKTIDGDLKCPPSIPVSFGFDTACRTYAELVGNIEVDALSSQKYYHFCRLMGRAASNIALEVALLTYPNVCLIGEEVQAKNTTLKELTEALVKMIQQRAKDGKNYGVVVLPEGLIEFIPEFNAMISEINELGDGLTEAQVLEKLTPEMAERFRFLPDFLRAQLLLDRDPHGNVQVAKIETEKLLASCVEQELKRLKEAGEFSGSFTAQYHAFGYEGRAGLPSRFDATYCYALGYTAGVLLVAGRTGLISSVQNLSKPVSEWICGGVPVTSLCVVERRKGKDKPVIRKALVEMEGPMCAPFKAWEAMRSRLALEDHYRCPGPLQFDNACPVSLDLPVTLALELGNALEPLPEAKPESVNYGKFLFCPRPVASRSKLQRWRTETASHSPGAVDAASFVAVTGLATHPPLSADADAIKKTLPTTFGAPLVEFKKVEGEKPEKFPGQNGVPVKIGMVFCGRQMPGGHDALFGAVEAMEERSGEVIGFVGGVKGLYEGNGVNLSEVATQYRRSGGIDLLGRTQDRLASTDEDMDKILAACKKFNLHGLVLIGGVRTATDAAYLAEYFAQKESKTSVILLPCGIENSLLNPFIEVSLGFDSASKTVAQIVANTCTDGASARKYYYFLRCMDGSSTGLECTSHLAMEIALAVRPNAAFVTAEIDDKHLSLRDIVEQVADTVCLRAAAGKNFGTVVVPETLFAAVPETRMLLKELEKCPSAKTLEDLLPHLSDFSAALMKSFPEYIQNQLLMERQSNGMVQLSQVQTEQFLADLVGTELKKRKATDDGKAPDPKKVYKGSFSPVCQFVGYQARTSMPSNFDAEYGRAMGAISSLLAAGGYNGYMASVSGLAGPVETWRCAGAPISSICDSTDSGVRVVPKRVDLSGPAWQTWTKMRQRCATEDLYNNPGPIQFEGCGSTTVSQTLALRATQWGPARNYLSTLEELRSKVEMLSKACLPGCETTLARAANANLSSLEEVIYLMSKSS